MPDETRTEPRRIEVLAVPYGVTSRRTASGYRERFRPGAVDPATLVGLPVIDAHTGTAVGVVEESRGTDAGVVTTLRLSDIPRARDLHVLAADGALGASLGFDADGKDATVDREGVVTRSRVIGREISLTPLPAYETARVLATREAPPMPETPTTEGLAPAADPSTSTSTSAPTETRSAPATAPAPAVTYATAADLETLAARIDAVRAAPVGTPGAAGHPLARFGSFGEFASAAFRGETTPDEIRALADQTTPNNPGVIPPSWLGDVRGIVARARHLIEGTGGALAPGASGMAAEWPYFDGDLAALVGVQAAEKTQVTTARVDLKRGTANLKTYAGGSDLAYQLIERSSPAYLDAYLRIMAAAYGVVTEAAYTADLIAAAGTGTAVGTDLGWFHEAVVAEAAAVFDATGQAPTVGAIAADAWASVAGAVDETGRPIFPPVGAVNAPGTPTGPGATGGIVVSGIPFYRSPSLPSGNALLTNGEAARWLEDGPRTVQAENVALLGRDVAVYGFATTAAFIPAGVRRLTGLPVPAPAAARSSK